MQGFPMAQQDGESLLVLVQVAVSCRGRTTWRLCFISISRRGLLPGRELIHPQSILVKAQECRPPCRKEEMNENSSALQPGTYLEIVLESFITYHCIHQDTVLCGMNHGLLSTVLLDGNLSVLTAQKTGASGDFWTRL
ncbi:hypothetical protein CapIbe_003787 [Capra ibex]